MGRRFGWSAWILLLGAATVGCGERAPLVPARTRAYRTVVAPFLQAHCAGCHGGFDPSGGLALDALAEAEEAPTPQALRADTGRWERMAAHVTAGIMPPGDEPRPARDARQAFSRWILDALEAAWAQIPPDPGRVTTRRLSRTEYANTMRDLLGVDLDVAAFLPRDDVGYGFDHIADVLSMPPILFEKYLAAAERIARQAVLAADPRRGRSRRFEAESRPRSASGRPAGDAYVLFSNGEVSATLECACAGVCLLRVRAWGQQAGPEAPRMVVRVDRRPVAEHAVQALSSEPAVYETSVELEAGTHQVTVGFVNDYYRPTHPDPGQRDRNLVLDYLEVEVPAEEREAGTDANLLACDPAPGAEAAAARTVLGRLLRRAFRRPPGPGEVERHLALSQAAWADGDGFWDGLQVAVEAVLVSPHFLFRIEADTAGCEEHGVRDLDDHELAVRLAYFLWSSVPDAHLDAHADAGSLRAALHDEVERMLDDPRAASLAENFAVQWLEIPRLDAVTPDPQRFGGFASLGAAMRRETELFVGEIFQSDRSVLDLLDAPFTYVNRALAAHYGLPDGVVAGDGYERIALTDARRGGLLGQASILTLTSYPTRTSPTQRGKWLLEEILGRPPPPPPPGVGTLEAQPSTLQRRTLRERLAAHRENPDCAVCHDRMDPLGFALENYDPIGAWRDAVDGRAVDTTGELPDGRRFDRPAALKALLRADPGFVRCFAEKLLTYALGRGLEPYDRPAVAGILRAAQAGDLRFRSFVHAIVTATPFTMRRCPGEPR